MPSGVSSGTKLYNSRYCFEVTRMILSGCNDTEIVENLKKFYNFHITFPTLKAFKDNFLSMTEKIIRAFNSEALYQAKLQETSLVPEIQRAGLDTISGFLKDLRDTESELEILINKSKSNSNLPNARIDLDLYEQMRKHRTSLMDLRAKIHSLTGGIVEQEKIRNTIRAISLAAVKIFGPEISETSGDTVIERFKQEVSRLSEQF